MGISDKFLTFGNSKKGQIIAWCLTIFSVVVFFVGVLTTSLGATIQTISSISISGLTKEMRTNSIAGGNVEGYFLEVNSIDTPITINPNPISTNAPVVLSVSSGNSYIEIKDTHIAAGGTTVLTLLKYRDIDLGRDRYYISDPDPSVGISDISIQISCANRKETLYIRIVPKPEDVIITPTLQSTISNNDPTSPSFDSPNNWMPANELDMANFFTNSLTKGDNYFRVLLTLSIFGVTIYDTEKKKDDYKYFDYTEINLTSSQSPSDIYLFNVSNNNSDYYITTSSTYQSDTTVNYKISCYFRTSNSDKGGTYYYFTNSNFLINIKGYGNQY